MQGLADYRLPGPHVPAREEEDSPSDTSVRTIRSVVPPSADHALTRRTYDTSPTHSLGTWRNFFEEKYTICSDRQANLIFNVYLTRPKHGAVLFLFHHGAGSSGLSFALVTTVLHALSQDYGYAAFEARGHGGTVYSQHDPDYSLGTLCDDFEECISKLFSCHFHEQPELFLVGHSMGGAIASQTAKRFQRVIGLAVIDVVEGSAVDALQSMQSYLTQRPASFKSLEDAIDWHVKTQTIRSIDSAQISVPDLLEERPFGDDALLRWTWKTNLLGTQSFWEGWYKGLSATFLSSKCGKLLILAGTDRLDKPLMIAQMQGLYQLAVVPHSGHFVQEDAPEQVARLLHDMTDRYQRSNDIIIQARRKFMAPTLTKF